MSEIIYINEKHEQLMVDYLYYIKKQVYEATEYCENGKYTDFQDVLDDIITYHNDFYKMRLADGDVSEWLFCIPNLALFTTLGFFAGLKSQSDKDFYDELQGKVHFATMELVGNLSDMLQDINLKKENVEC